MRGLILAVAALIATPALADAALPIRGAFGNDAGCEFFQTGHVLDESLLILTPDNFVTSDTACHFEALSDSNGERYELASSCQGEDGEPNHGTVSVAGNRSDGYRVVIGGMASEWGPLLPCPRTEEAFRPLGTQI